MTIEFYKVLHICGILLIFSGLAGACAVFAAKQVDVGLKKVLGMVHGVGLLLVIVSGMAMAGKEGFLSSVPFWLMGKVLIWLALGGTLALAKRKVLNPPALIGLWVLLGSTAAYLAIYKP